MRRTAPLLVAALALGPVAAMSPALAQPSGARVQVIDFEYSPAAVTIPAGATVEWEWAGASQHTVTARDGSFDEQRERNGRFVFLFRVPGRYEYFCRIHAGVMVGAVTVEGGSTAPASPSPRPTSSAPAPSPTSARPAPSPTPGSTSPVPQPLPSPAAVSPSPSPATAGAPSASRTQSAPAASSGSPSLLPAPTVTSRSPVSLVSLDEPRPKDRTGLAIALGLVVAAAGIGFGGTVLLRGRPRSLPPVE